MTVNAHVRRPHESMQFIAFKTHNT